MVLRGVVCRGLQSHERESVRRRSDCLHDFVRHDFVVALLLCELISRGGLLGRAGAPRPPGGIHDPASVTRCWLAVGNFSSRHILVAFRRSRRERPTCCDLILLVPAVFAGLEAPPTRRRANACCPKFASFASFVVQGDFVEHAFVVCVSNDWNVDRSVFPSRQAQVPSAPL